MNNSVLFSEYLLLRLLINSVSMVILIHLVYYGIYKKKDFYFTFFLLNLIIFLLAYMLEYTKAFTSFGSAFGLLAAFSLLRFRTESISIKDMTYLFITMTIGLINSIMKGTYWEIIVLNGVIIGVVYLVDGRQLIRQVEIKFVEYDNLENIQPGRQKQLIEDLQKRTGLDIQKIVIEHIDFVKNKAIIKVYFY